jgi:hypothetical protein
MRISQAARGNPVGAWASGSRRRGFAGPSNRIAQFEPEFEAASAAPAAGAASGAAAASVLVRRAFRLRALATGCWRWQLVERMLYP